MAGAEPIYHVARDAELRAGLRGDRYEPPGLAREGFVHCAPGAAVLAVARDCFAGVDGTLWLLRLDPERLGAPLRLEAPATRDGWGREHLEQASRFPHLYGPVELDAIDGVGRLAPAPGGFAWPRRWHGLREVLGGAAGSSAPSIP